MDEINQRIIRKVKKGNRKAFGKLIDFYKQNVYQICVINTGDASIAETLARDVFLYAYSHINDYNMKGRFSLWLYSITVDKIMGCLYVKNHDFLTAETKKNTQINLTQ